MEENEPFLDMVFVVRDPKYGGVYIFENVEDIPADYDGANVGRYHFHEMLTFHCDKTLHPSKLNENNPRA